MEVLTAGLEFAVSRDAADLCNRFEQYLTGHLQTDGFQRARTALAGDPVAAFELCRDWLHAFTAAEKGFSPIVIDETAWLLLRGTQLHRSTVEVSASRKLEAMKGHHARITGGSLLLDYHDFFRRMRAHESTVVPVYERYQSLKKLNVETARERLRLDDFKPKVLTSFVRNRLIDSAYLPADRRQPREADRCGGRCQSAPTAWACCCSSRRRVTARPRSRNISRAGSESSS
jgi:hypothetical protein